MGFSAVMQQYMAIKEAHKEALVFFRIGDFYELFFDDARLASQKLGLVLTSRETGQGKAPMCGVPFHAAEGYIKHLVDLGHRVALCEQIGTPRKGEILSREVVRVYTPGTIIDDTKSGANFIAVIYQEQEAGIQYGLAYCDVATGDFLTTSFNDFDKLLNEIYKINPAEIVVNPAFSLSDGLAESTGIKPVIYHIWAFYSDIAKEKLLSHFNLHNLEGLGLGDDAKLCASGALLCYLSEMQAASLSHINSIEPYSVSDFMILDKNARRNLELTETLREKESVGSLFWVLNQTKTAMGERLLRKWLENPLLQKNDIECRHQAVGEYAENEARRDEIREKLGEIVDLERICARINYGRITVTDLGILSRSITALGAVKGLLTDFSSKLNSYFFESLDNLQDISIKIDHILPDGESVGAGCDAELDRLRDRLQSHLELLAALEARERLEGGIKSLKIGQNKVFGYYFEIGKSYKGPLPTHFQRRQTLSGSERYVTEELKRLEADILHTTECIENLEASLFKGLRMAVAKEIPRIRLTAQMIAAVDALQSLGYVAAKYNYVCPEMMNVGIIEIKAGRHAVVERLLGLPFVANNVYLDNFENKIAVLTGPNMAGKSTYLRQTALICIMAQMGGFVPAKAARLPICDQIFARVGSSDDLGRGQSTFMVEMNEVAAILNNATKNSLIILDEIGRGTSTSDGFAIALAIMEHIAANISALTLFATHFHELTAAEGQISGVVNYCMQVQESGGNITFTRKIARGGADKSYGIAVAKLAGLPAAVVERSAQIQAGLKFDKIYDEEAAQKRNDFKKRVRMFLEEYGYELDSIEERILEEGLS